MVRGALGVQVLQLPPLLLDLLLQPGGPLLVARHGPLHLLDDVPRGQVQLLRDEVPQDVRLVEVRESAGARLHLTGGAEELRGGGGDAEPAKPPEADGFEAGAGAASVSPRRRPKPPASSLLHCFIGSKRLEAPRWLDGSARWNASKLSIGSERLFVRWRKTGECGAGGGA